MDRASIDLAKVETDKVPTDKGLFVESLTMRYRNGFGYRAFK
jgi:hypothetical protein